MIHARIYFEIVFLNDEQLLDAIDGIGRMTRWVEIDGGSAMAVRLYMVLQREARQRGLRP